MVSNSAGNTKILRCRRVAQSAKNTIARRNRSKKLESLRKVSGRFSTTVEGSVELEESLATVIVDRRWKLSEQTWMTSDLFYSSAPRAL